MVISSLLCSSCSTKFYDHVFQMSTLGQATTPCTLVSTRVLNLHIFILQHHHQHSTTHPTVSVKKFFTTPNTRTRSRTLFHFLQPLRRSQHVPPISFGQSHRRFSRSTRHQTEQANMRYMRQSLAYQITCVHCGPAARPSSVPASRWVRLLGYHARGAEG